MKPKRLQALRSAWALLPRNPWLRVGIIVLPLLILAILLGPVFQLSEVVIATIQTVLSPLLASPSGRLLLLNVVLFLVLGFALFILRVKVRALRSGLVLRRHFDGISFLLEEDRDKAKALLTKVATTRAPLPSEFPIIREDAKLKLVRLALEGDEVEGAMRWLLRIREAELPAEMLRSLYQLRAETHARQGQVLALTRETDLREALERFPDDLVLLRHLRTLVRARGDLDEVATIQERVFEAAFAKVRDKERQVFVTDLVAAGRAALARGDLDRARQLARRAQELDADAAPPGILSGEVYLAHQDARAAIREWGKIASPAGLERIGRLLDERPGLVEPRVLLEDCPVDGALLLVAREYARAGEARRAERATRLVAERVGLTARTAPVIAEVLERVGRPEEASRIYKEAVRRLLAPGEEKG